jgi:haloalkane dehalogenase
VPPALYPFASHWHDRGGGIHLHYLDEGPREAPPVVMVHGNPTWSFYYRNLVTALRGTHRCLVPDHVGCGFSDRPGDDRYAYTLQSRVDDLEGWLDAVGAVKNVTLVVHDWGGMIGLAAAVRKPERIARIVLLNTGAFPLPSVKPLPPTLRLGRDTALGAFLITRFNAFARGAVVLAAKTKLSDEVARGLTAPYDAPGDRLATLRFVQDIPLDPQDRAWPVVEQTAAKLSSLAGVPMLICWGMKDFVFDRHFLEEFERRFPAAEVHRFANAGHYVLEDEPAAIIGHVKAFLATHPLA